MDIVEILKNLKLIDWLSVIIAIILVVVAAKYIWSLFDWLFIEKLGIKTKKMRQREEERDLLNATAELARITAENLDKLQEKHCKDEEEFRENLNNYMKESREDRRALHEEMKVYSDNRIHDRQQSLEIQKELKDSIASRDTQINALMDANKETLASKINEKYKHYISIGGIPEDEYDEFVGLHSAYKGVGGNSHGDAKFEYCIEHLPILPVDIKLVIKHDKE